MKHLITSAVVMLLTLPAAQAPAAPSCDTFTIDDSDRPTADDEFASALTATAMQAKAAQCLTQADRLLEGAHRLDPRPRLIYERVLVRELMKDYEYAHTLIEAYRSELAADPTIDDLVALDARLRAKLREPSVVEEPVAAVPAKRSTLDTVGPLVLGGLGVVALGAAVVGFTAKCRLEAADGQCLQGSETNAEATLAYAAGGVAAVTAAAVWWVIAVPRPSPSTASLSLAGLTIRF